MEIRKKVVVKEEKEKLIDIKCNICFNSCLSGEKAFKSLEYLEMKSNWDFNSKKDLEKWTAHICENCVDKYLTKLIIFDIKEKYDNKKEKQQSRKRKIRKILGLNLKIC